MANTKQTAQLGRIRGAFSSFPYSGSVELKKWGPETDIEQALAMIEENINLLSEAVKEGNETANERERELERITQDVNGMRRLFGLTQ